jgi:hypothetical protein
VMKSRCLKVTGHGTHSGDVVSGNEYVSAVDHLSVKQLVVRLQCKAQKKAVSNILLTPPNPDLLSDPNKPTQQSAPVQNPLSVVTSITNNTYDAPFLQEEMATIVTPKVTKRQCLMNNDCSDGIYMFEQRKALGFTALSQLTLKTKQKLITAAFCFNFWTS